MNTRTTIKTNEEPIFISWLRYSEHSLKSTFWSWEFDADLIGKHSYEIYKVTFNMEY